MKYNKEMRIHNNQKKTFLLIKDGCKIRGKKLFVPTINFLAALLSLTGAVSTFAQKNGDRETSLNEQAGKWINSSPVFFLENKGQITDTENQLNRYPDNEKIDYFDMVYGINNKTIESIHEIEEDIRNLNTIYFNIKNYLYSI